jgi:hypothetical protein
VENRDLSGLREVGLNPFKGVGGTPSILRQSYGYNVNIISISALIPNVLFLTIGQERL